MTPTAAAERTPVGQRSNDFNILGGNYAFKRAYTTLQLTKKKGTREEQSRAKENEMNDYFLGGKTGRATAGTADGKHFCFLLPPPLLSK